MLLDVIDELAPSIADLRDLEEEARKARADQAVRAVAVAERSDCSYVLVRVPKRDVHLTEREREVALLAGDGYRNCEIAEKLAIREATVSAHLRHALRKLGVNHRSELALQRPVLQAR